MRSIWLVIGWSGRVLGECLTQADAEWLAGEYRAEGQGCTVQYCD